MPALIVVILARARFTAALLPALLATTVALLVALVLGVLLLRALGASRPAQGSAGLVSAFSNTAFLGVPFILALFPAAPAAATTAVIIDTVDTTILLLTLGTTFAATMAGARTTAATAGSPWPRIGRGLLTVLRQPLLVAVVIGLGLAASDVALPSLLAGPLTQIGQATPTLAFLTIGLGLDLGSLRGL